MDIKPRDGYVLLEDVTKKHRGTQKFDEQRHDQPVLAKIVSFEKPQKADPQYIPWDYKIKVGAVVLKPVTQKREFSTGDGRTMIICHHSDIKVFFNE
jgi:hypothetical protein